MRGSDPDAAVYYLAAMLEGGEDARFIARRMIVLASEDIGNADPRALLVAVAAAQAVEHVGLPGGAAEPRAGGHLPRARAEVERGRTSRSRRRRATCASAATCDRRRRCERGHPRREAARPRPGLRLPARRSARLRRRLPAGRAARARRTTARAGQAKKRGLVRAPADALAPPSRPNGEPSVLVGRRGLLEVVLGAAELERAAAVPERVRRADVAVERHPDAAGVDQVVPCGPSRRNWRWLCPKTIVRSCIARQQLGSSGPARARSCRRRASGSRGRRGRRRARPAPGSEYSQPSSSPRARVVVLAASRRPPAGPAAAPAASARRCRESRSCSGARAGASIVSCGHGDHDVVAAQEPAIGAGLARVRQHGLERRQVAVDVVQRRRARLVGCQR